MVRTTPPRDGGTPAESRRTLLDVYRETVAGSPDRLAIDCKDGQLTHIELFDAARALAGRLARRGIGAGDRVAIHIPDGTVDRYVAILGVLFAGAAYLPIGADAGASAGAAAAEVGVISEPAAVTAVIEPGLTVGELRAPSGERRPVHPDDGAWVAFGPAAPRGDVVTHRRALALIDAGDGDGTAIEMWLAWRSGDVLVPKSHVQSITPE